MLILLNLQIEDKEGDRKLLNIGRYRRGFSYYGGFGYYGGAQPQGRQPPKFNSFREALKTGAQKLTNNASTIFRAVGDGAQIFEGVLALNDLFFKGPDRIPKKTYISIGMGILTIFDNLITFGRWLAEDAPAIDAALPDVQQAQPAAVAVAAAQQPALRAPPVLAAAATPRQQQHARSHTTPSQRPLTTTAVISKKRKQAQAAAADLASSLS